MILLGERNQFLHRGVLLEVGGFSGDLHDVKEICAVVYPGRRVNWLQVI